MIRLNSAIVRPIFAAGVPAGVLFFKSGQCLAGVVGVTGRGKSEELTVGGVNATDKLTEMGVLHGVGVVPDALPVVVGASKGELPDVTLAVLAKEVAARVPAVVVEDGHRATGGDHRFGARRILVLAVGVGGQECRALIRVDVFEAEPEVELAVAVVGFSGRQQ